MEILTYKRSGWVKGHKNNSVRSVVELGASILLVILFLVSFAYFPPQYIIGICVVLFLGITVIYRTGRRDAIEAYNKELIREGTWIRVTKDITVKTQSGTIALKPFTMAYVINVSAHGSSYDILIDPHSADFYQHRVLHLFDNYRHVTIVPAQDVDEELQAIALKELKALQTSFDLEGLFISNNQ